MHSVNTASQSGQIHITDEVLSIISGTAALEVDGVIAGQTTADAMRLGKKSFSRGIKITAVGDEVTVDLPVFVKFGYKIHVVSEEVQKRVKLALETMVGMKVKEVNVNVVGVLFEKVPKVKQAARR